MTLDELGQNNTTATLLPEELTQRIENAKNNFTILEIETQRLSKLQSNQMDQISKLTEEKKTLESQIEVLKKAIDNLITTNAQKEIEAKNFDAVLTNAKAQLSEAQITNQGLLSQQTERNRELDMREGAIKSYEEDYNKRNIDLIARETQHAQKVERLQEALK